MIILPVALAKKILKKNVFFLLSSSLVFLVACGGETETSTPQGDTNTRIVEPQQVENSAQRKESSQDFSKGRITVTANGKRTSLAVSDCRGVIFKSGDTVKNVALSVQANNGGKEAQFQINSKPPLSASVTVMIDELMEGNIPVISIDSKKIHLKGNVTSNNVMKGEKGKSLSIEIQASCIEGFSQQGWE